ncbi:hypothetical protein ACSBR1_031195 [Camellia fascicularis]
MGAFINLDDSLMFQKQISGIEQQTDELKDRCQRLYKRCEKYMETLGETCNGDTSFADSLEAFGGSQDDPVSVSIGGPVMSKFIVAFRELARYKELFRSQVEHVLIDRLSQFLSVDVQDAKDEEMLVPHSDLVVEGPQPMEVVAQAETGNTTENQQVEEPQTLRFTWRIENFSRLNTKKLYSEFFCRWWL